MFKLYDGMSYDEVFKEIARILEEHKKQLSQLEKRVIKMEMNHRL
jgi:predicted site-specific integrase-resolvase